MKKIFYIVFLIFGIYSTTVYSKVNFNETNSAVDNLNQLRKNNPVITLDYAMCLTHKQKEELEQSGLVVDCVFPYVTTYKAEFFPEYRENGWGESFGDTQTNVYLELKALNGSTENNLKNSKERLSLNKKDLDQIYVATFVDYNKKFKDNAAELADKSIAWLHESQEGTSFISGPNLDTVIKKYSQPTIDNVRSSGFNFKEISDVLLAPQKHQKYGFVADSIVTFNYPIEAYSVDFISSYEDDEYGVIYQNLKLFNGITEKVNKSISGIYTCEYEFTEHIFNDSSLYNSQIKIPGITFNQNKMYLESYNGERTVEMFNPGITLTKILRELYPREIFKPSYGDPYNTLITPTGLYFLVQPASEPEKSCNYGLAVIPLDKLRSYMNAKGNEWLDKYLTFFKHQWY